MDLSTEHDQKLQIAENFNNYQFVRRILQFVFSISVFSFFIWYSSGFSLLPDHHSFNVYFSTFPFSVVSHTLERKYMFLICNGILVLIAKTSISSSPSIPAFNLEFQASNFPETNAPVSEELTPLALASSESPENTPVIVEEELEEARKQEGYEEVSEAEEVEEDSNLCTEMEGGKYEASLAAEEEEEEEEEEEGKDEGEGDAAMATNEELANTDELNRKFEEFIRKMKEEIRIEAQRQLIAV